MLSKERILVLFSLLDERLAQDDVVGELYRVGGAVMCLALNARPSTADVDALYVPKEAVRHAARQLAADEGISEDWLNDAVKGFLSDRGDFSPWLELDHLKVFVPLPEYLLAMKCLALRLGPEFRDEEDVRYLLRYLNIETADDALAIVGRYYPADRVPQFALEEMLSKVVA